MPRALLDLSCPLHGTPTKRDQCLSCNAAYMRGYLRKRRLQLPHRYLWERAKQRAGRLNIPFSIERTEIDIPAMCPVLGIPIIVGVIRSQNSPSLDRIVPSLGYVPGNVRVISDRANRLKGDRSAAQLRDLAETALEENRRDFLKIAEYVHREELLAEVREKAQRGGRAGQEWAKIADYLERVFSKGIPEHRLL